jgi:translation initiation factor 1
MDLSFLENKSDDPFGNLDNQTTHLSKEKIHIRLQDQKNRKLTIIEGLDKDLDQERIAKAMKRVFSCSTKVNKDTLGNEVIVLQGDQRLNVRQWLLAQEILTQQEVKERLVLHGF